MKSVRTILIALAVGAMSFAAAAATTVVQAVKEAPERLSELGAATLRTVGVAFNRAIEQYMATSGLALYAVYKSDTYTGVKPRRNTPMSTEPLQIPIPITLPAVNVLVNDIIILAEVPEGVDVVDYTLVGDDADTNAAPAIAASLGTMNAGLTDLATVWKAGITVFQNAGIQRLDNSAPFVESNVAKRVIGLKWTAAAATYAAGKKGLLILHVAG